MHAKLCGNDIVVLYPELDEEYKMCLKPLNMDYIEFVFVDAGELLHTFCVSNQGMILVKWICNTRKTNNLP